MATRIVGNGKSKRGNGLATPESPAPEIKLLPRTSAAPGPVLRILLTDAATGHHEMDLTREFTSVIAHALWCARGGDDTANWVDAERLLDRMLGAKPRATPERRIGPKQEDEIGPLPEPPLPVSRRETIKR